MAAKTISIGEDVYMTLLRVKRPRESFTEEIRRLLEKKGKVSECLGLWAQWMKKEEIAGIDKAIATRRRIAKAAKAKKVGLNT